MRVALVADVFPPLHSSGAVQLRDLAIEFARQGHKITAMVAAPDLHVPWVLEDVNGVEVLRLRTPITRDRGYVARTLGEFLMPYSMLRGLRQSPLTNVKFDAVLWYSPTIFLGPIIKALKKQSKCSAYLIIRDIFPEWAWEMGLISSKAVYRCFKEVAHYQYAQADVIGIQTPGNEVYFSSWKVKHPDARIEVLHNWLSDAPDVGCSVRVSQSKLAGRKVFVYAGNMGVAQNTEVFCKLAVRLQHRADLGFLFVGRGSESVKLADQFGALPNVLFCDEIASEEIPGLYAQCQVGLVALDPRHKSHNIPGKFLSYMQAGLPVLACVNTGNDLIELISAHNVGVVIDDDADDHLDQAALEVLLLAQEAETGSRCRDLAMNMFSSSRAVNQIVSSLAGISQKF
jgi:glycosyltransferase involved in cell wall biosynthesis